MSSSSSFKAFRKFRPTRPRLTASNGNKNYYKGRGAGAQGKHIMTGYKLDIDKIKQFVVPDLTGFELTPFAAATADVNASGAFKPSHYASFWKHKLEQMRLDAQEKGKNDAVNSDIQVVDRKTT